MVDNSREIIAANILFYRKRAAITQSEMASRAKISLRTAQRAEDPGSGGMDIDIFLAIAEGIGVHPSKLMLAAGERVPVSPLEAWEIVGKALTERRESPAPSVGPAHQPLPTAPDLDGIDPGKLSTLLNALRSRPNAINAALAAAGVRNLGDKAKHNAG